MIARFFRWFTHSVHDFAVAVRDELTYEFEFRRRGDRRH